MFPIVFVLGLGYWRGDKTVGQYGLILSVGGAVMALWHLGIFYGIVSEAIQPCTATGPSCSDENQLVLGVPIPLLSFATFSAIAILTAHCLWKTEK